MKVKHIFKISFIVICLFFFVTCLSCKCSKKEEVLISKLEVKQSEVYLNVNEKVDLGLSIYPDDATNKEIKTEYDNNIINYENGVIEGISTGVTELKIYNEVSNKETSVTIYVSDPENNEYPILIIGWTPELNYDYDVCCTYYSDTGLYQLPTPESVNGYAFNGWIVDGEYATSIDAGTTGLVILFGEWTTVASEIYVEELTHNLCVDETYKIEAITDTSESNFNYASSDEDVLVVSAEGVVTAKAVGSATVTISSKDNSSLTADLDISVLNKPESLSYRKEIGSIFIGRKATLNVTSSPSKTSKDVVYTVSDESILSVDAKGGITPLKEGVVTIRATSIHNDSVYVEQTVTVLTPASSVEVSGLDQDEYYIGSVINLSSSVTPLNVSQEVVYEVSDETIGTISEDGILSIIGRGELTVVVRSKVSLDIMWKKTIDCLHELMDEENSDVKYIICCPGEDATNTICINYHAKNTKTYIEYTIASDTEFNNAIEFIPEGRYFEEMDEKYESPFEARNIFYSEITGLTPGTDYIFRVNKGDGTYSDIYHFTTAGGKGNDFSFIWLTDNHYHDATNLEPTYLYSDDVVKKALELRPDLAFVFDTGDMIDRGGAASHWEIMFNNKHILKDLPLVSTTGNHELYMNGTGQTDNRFHSAYNAQPKNSVEGKIGTSCYFIYNDVLFIMFESVASNSYTEQLEWLEEVLRTTREENSAKMIVIGTHKPVHSENASYMIQDRDMNVMALCDKYAVDLVLTGHYHSELITPDYYGGTNSTNPLLGTNYLIGNACRLEGKDANGYIIDVINGNTFRVNHIDNYGNIIQTWEFKSKKEEVVSSEAQNTSKETIVNSLTYTLDSVNNNVKFEWTSLAYGNVKNIVVEELLRGVDKAEAYIINSAYTNTVIGNYIKYQDVHYKITFNFYDGDVITKEIYLKRDSTLNHKAIDISKDSAIIKLESAHSSLNYKIKKYNIYLNGKLIDTVDYLVNDEPLEMYSLSGLSKNTEYSISFEAIDARGNVMFINELIITTRK